MEKKEDRTRKRKRKRKRKSRQEGLCLTGFSPFSIGEFETMRGQESLCERASICVYISERE